MHSMRVIGEKLGDYSHLGSGHTGRITCSMHCMRVIGLVRLYIQSSCFLVVHPRADCKHAWLLTVPAACIACVR